MHICSRLMTLLHDQGLDDTIVVVGGIVPEADIAELKALGIRAVFVPGSPMQQIIDFLYGAVRPRAEAL